MPRTKGSKNKPKTVTADFATQIAEKQSAKEALTAEIASMQVHEQLMLQIMTERIAAHHLLGLFIKMAVDKKA